MKSEILDHLKEKRLWTSISYDILFFGIVLIVGLLLGNSYGVVSNIMSFLAIVLLYSFFKSRVVKALSKKTDNKNKKFCKMTVINIVLMFALLVILAISYSSIQYFFVYESQKLYFGLVLFWVLFVFYFITNITHIVVLTSKHLGYSFKIFGKNIKSFFLMYLVEIVFLIMIMNLAYFLSFINVNLLGLDILFKTLAALFVVVINAINRLKILTIVEKS